MRLRQLGTTQSVAFLAAPEVHRAILDLRLAHTRDAVQSHVATSPDVVRWLLDQSCKANEQMMSLYLSQCWDFCRRTDILWKHSDYATSQCDLQKVLGVIRQEEQQSLQHMYGPRAAAPSALTDRVRLASPRLVEFAQNVERMARHGQPSCSAALMEVEQEREVVLEVEHMREKETQRQHTALTFPGLESGLLDFVKTGWLDTRATRSRAALMQAFDFIGKTKIGRLFRIQATQSGLYVSREFVQTVKKVMEKGDIVRPVHWILWSPSTETGLIIIPEEADAVIPLLRKMAKPLVWLLGYTAPVTKSMQNFHSLSYLTVPQWPSTCQIPVWLGIEVGILSGRLYFDFAEYKPLLAWLGLLPDQERAACFAGRKTEQPLQFLQEWLSFRRRTEDVLYTPVGFVCQRQLLHEGHFFFSGPAGASVAEGRSGREELAGHDDDDENDIGVDY